MNILNSIPFSNIPWNEIIAVLSAIVLVILRNLHKNLNNVKHQVSKNGGTSLHDVINRIEKKLDEFSSLHEALHQISQTPMYRANTVGEFLWVNNAYTLLTGRSIQDLKGNGWLSVIHPEDKDYVYTEWKHCVEDKRRFDLTFRVLNSFNGECFTVSSKSYPIEKNSEIIGYVGVWYIIERDSKNDSDTKRRKDQV
jgi:PAS domain S-box-containing protein